MDETLDQAPVTHLKGVGPALATKLDNLGIRTLQDVLFHLPLRYEDRTRVTRIGSLREGMSVVIEGEVLGADIAYGRRRSLVVVVDDGTGRITLRFFHFSQTQQAGLKRSNRVRCFGEVRRGPSGPELFHPEYTTKFGPLEEALTPVYPATEGLSQQKFRNIVHQVIDLMRAGRVVTNLGYRNPLVPESDINQALQTLHAPPPGFSASSLENGRHPAMLQLTFEELLAHHLSMRLIRQQAHARGSFPMTEEGDLANQFVSQLPFPLTAAQRRVVSEINADLSLNRPMLRLLQGDVGSGKTVVAALAATKAIANNLQAVIMAPTEILAEQHLLNFSAWFEPLGIQIAWLTGRTTGRKRAQELEKLASGSAQLAVGTHALFQDGVTFRNLGLVIIDEQHRFGVQQRLALREKGETTTALPHQLVMTATPIPRTLTMSLYADMDSSIIDELPPGRQPVVTRVLPDTRRSDVLDRIESACRAGDQAYWVCTLIDESEALQCQAAEVTAAELTDMYPDLNVGLLHGRMGSKEKTSIMNAFKQREIDLLVATTVIEVGVDVPNASLMVIENPERLGLAQLHQLRGRVGRGNKESFCLLLYHPPLGVLSRQRLNVMRETEDGFRIAEKDLEIRGPGEIFGARQSGEVQFRLADLNRDAFMLDEVRHIADQLLTGDPALVSAIMDRWLVNHQIMSQV